MTNYEIYLPTVFSIDKSNNQLHWTRLFFFKIYIGKHACLCAVYIDTHIKHKHIAQ